VRKFGPHDLYHRPRLVRHGFDYRMIKKNAVNAL
jgi:hypothetical protein